jgi:hypothetical protein
VEAWEDINDRAKTRPLFCSVWQPSPYPQDTPELILITEALVARAVFLAGLLSGVKDEDELEIPTSQSVC